MMLITYVNDCVHGRWKSPAWWMWQYTTEHRWYR